MHVKEKETKNNHTENRKGAVVREKEKIEDKKKYLKPKLYKTVKSSP